MKHLQRFFFCLVALAIFSVPYVADACEPVTLCVNWTVELDDGFAGDHLTGETTPARGNRVMIIRPAPEPPLGLFLNAEGCTSFETQFNAGHKVVLYNEAVVDQFTHVRAFEGSEALDEGTTSTWIVDVPVISDNDMISVEVPIDPEMLSNLMGVTVEALYRLDRVPGPGMPSTPRQLFPYKDPAPNANAYVDALRIGAGAEREKFLIGHEIGHWLVLQDGGWGVSFSYSPTDDDCRFTSTEGGGDVGGHALRSAERASGAMTEGFAHFAAAAAFNDPEGVTGMFRYYKELDIQAHGGSSADLDQGNYLVSIPDGPTGGVNRWTELQCPSDFTNTGAQEISTELDWMRFFWDFISAPGEQPSLWDVVALYRFANTSPQHSWSGAGPVWPNLLAALQEMGPASYATRFQNLEPDHGLVND